MNRAFKYRIYPTDKQKIQIAKTIGCCRLMYNQLLDDCYKQLEQTGKVQVKYYTEIKKNYDFMPEVSASALNHSGIIPLCTLNITTSLHIIIFMIFSIIL